MNYNVKLTKDSAKVIEFPDVYLHFADHNFSIVWNPETKHHDSVKGVHTYYGGCGEGSTHKTWQDAIHASLYDYFQYGEEFHDGDQFHVVYRGKVANFHCDGVHVVRM